MGLHKVKGKGWRYDFTVNGRRFSKAWFPTKGAAIAAREEHRKQVMTEAPTATGITFSVLANEYLDYAERKFIAKTYKYKASVYRNFIAVCGDIPITDLTATLVEAYLRTRKTNTNYNTHRKDLCALFHWAWRRRLLPENPCLYVDKLYSERLRKEIYTQEDMMKLFMAAGDLRLFFLALFSLAARINEINRLKWEDVNFERREVTLWTRKGTGDWRPQVKAMNEELYGALKALYGKNSGQWVFPNQETGQPYIDRRKQLKKICQAAGIPYLGFHAIRHHVASLLADTHKVSLPTIQKMLGHSRLTTTERYVQSLGNGVREAADLLTSSTQDQHTNKKEASR